MAGNNAIQILRGTSAKIAASTETLLPGQLLYNTDKGYLTCAGNAAASPNIFPVKAAELIVYRDDATSAKITESTASPSGVKVENDKLKLYSYKGPSVEIGDTTSPLTIKNSSVTINTPNKSGTLALTSDIDSCAKLSTANTFTGVNTFNASVQIQSPGNLIISNDSNHSATYTATMITLNDSGNSYNLTFPKKTGKLVVGSVSGTTLNLYTQ